MLGDDDRVLLETGRLRLRRLTVDDVGHLVELDSDPEVMRFLTNGRPTPVETIREQLTRTLAQYDRHPDLGRWAALDRVTGQFLGWFALTPSDDGTEAELGYRLRRSAWGSGLATEGSRALVRHALGTAGVRRVWAETMAVNVASRRVMAKAGLRYVRTFHLTWDDPIPGTEHGEVEYELRREDWRPGGHERPAALRAR
ncbi:RimJ/RimL family protein N-acetyltransferase [Micromonospora kangleipakensis]|uniref:RimJ/RimL family protein N-acetyltransferase n=1 Tax=Micromonospora kangleipakensis TaxID=1077942 RepID=A0A4Q8B3H5_9ACTN|nr:GNAT family N-acetyltransferase [Micromonospora kangleipakensis]RZU72037.1 RimJ/RimL family protein N-acetyltransferase [Micromonospora kangleipakensis]